MLRIRGTAYKKKPMSLNSDSAPADAIANALCGPCVTMHRAVCTEAIRVVFALHFLSRSGFDRLTSELQLCRRAGDAGASFTRSLSMPFAALAEVSEEDNPESMFGLVEKPTSPLCYRGDGGVPHHHAGLREVSHGARGTPETSFATLAAARSCIERASQVSLCTAAHLLRCSAWTAASLTGGAMGKPNAEDRFTSSLSVPLTEAPSLARQAHALEVFRTQEPGWCATALVRFTEWFLREEGSTSARACLAHALSMTAYARAPLPNCSSPSEGKSSVDRFLSPIDRSKWYSFQDGDETHAAKVDVEDPLPLLFPWLRRQLGNAAWAEKENYCCCDHRWFLEDLPRCCARVAGDRLAATSRRYHALRDVVARWRARRGLRVMSRLSHAAEQPADVTSTPVETDASRQKGQREIQAVNGGELGEAVLASSQVAPPVQRQAAECQTDQVDASSEPAYWVAQDVGATPCVKSESEQQTPPVPSPAVSSSTPARGQTEKTSTTFEVSLLDRVLQGSGGEQQTSGTENGSAGVSQVFHTGEIAQRPSADSAVASSSAPACVCTVTAKEPCQLSAASTAVSGRDDVLVDLSAAQSAKPQDTERISVVQDRRSHRLLRTTFLHWRNRRLYESMAARYICGQQAHRTTQQCWCVWRRRVDAACRRRKEAHDDAVGDVVTEQKAVRYFGRLLQVWLRATLARRFRMQTVARRVFSLWRCNAVLAHYQRTTKQRFLGAPRTKRAVWQQWCERQRDVVADHHHACYLIRWTFTTMQMRCKECVALRIAKKHYDGGLTAQVWRTWRTRLTHESQLRVSTSSVNGEERLRKGAWKLWRVRLFERQQNRRREDQIAHFYKQYTLRRCISIWLSRYAVETRVRRCVEQRQRSLLMKPAFERWCTRAEVCRAVRHGREQLAWKVGDQLQCRRVLRMWRRRATAHAAARLAARATQIEDEADCFAQLRRLARTFYHWRARGFILCRYHVDRRHRLPTARRTERIEGEVCVPSVVLRTAAVTVSADAESPGITAQASTARSEVVKALSAATSSVSSASPSARVVSPRVARRTAPQRRRVTPAAGREDGGGNKSGTKKSVDSSDSPQRRSLVGKTRVVVVNGSLAAMPSWKRALALERQLFAVQRCASLSALGISLLWTSKAPSPVSTAHSHSHSTPRVAKADTTAKPSSLHSPFSLTAWHFAPHASTRNAQGRARHRHCFQPSSSPPSTPIEDSTQSSDVDCQHPIRSHTATPLFKRRGCHESSPAAPPRTAFFSSGLVETPPQDYRRQPRTTSHSEAFQEDDERSDLPHRGSSNRLLSRMELLLQRVRDIEASYRSPPPTQSHATQLS